MRIALACPYAWDAAGGVQVHVGDLARRLLDAGHDVRVLAPSSNPADEPWVRVVGRPLRVAYAGTVAPICPSPRSWARVRAELDVFAPDVVHVHEPFAPSTGMAAALAARAPVVATFHAYLDRSRIQRAARPLLRPVARRITVGIAVSEAAASFARRATDLPLEVIPNGVEIARFRRGAGRRGAAPPTIAWVNRLDPQKGFAVFLDAIAPLLARRPDLRVVVAGDGPLRDATDRLAPALRGRIDVRGRVANAEVANVLHGADVFASPATGQESFGIVLVEAMAAGVPVVATDIPGYREVVRDGIDGLLVPPGDAAVLAAALGRVLDDPALAARLAAAGLDRAAAYGWDAVLPRILATYERVLGRPRAADGPP